MASPAPNPRLSPPWHHPRYYGLRAVRHALYSTFQKHLAPGAQVLDYGCGTAPYRPLVTQFASNYLQADLAANPSAAIHIHPTTGQINLPDAAVDVVLSTQVLEHVPSPAEYLTEARRISRPDGLLILSTHGFWKYHPDPTDFWRWTAAGLHRLVSAHGWTVIDHTGVLGFAAASACLFQDAIAQRLPKFLRPANAVVMQRVVAGLDLLYSPEQRKENAAVYVVVAKATPPTASAATPTDPHRAAA